MEVEFRGFLYIFAWPFGQMGHRIAKKRKIHTPFHAVFENLSSSSRVSLIVMYHTHLSYILLPCTVPGTYYFPVCVRAACTKHGHTPHSLFTILRTAHHLLHAYLYSNSTVLFISLFFKNSNLWLACVLNLKIERCL